MKKKDKIFIEYEYHFKVSCKKDKQRPDQIKISECFDLKLNSRHSPFIKNTTA